MPLMFLPKKRILWIIGLLLGLLALIPSAVSEDPFFAKRRRMVELDIKARGIRNEAVLDAMMTVPRHLFVAESLRGEAYEDHPLPIGEGQTISQPYVVALMTEALRLNPGDRVLKIGTGSGYQAAVLARVVKEVYTMEIRQALAERAEKTLETLGFRNVKVIYGDGYFGWQEYAPFDAIVITASANHIPPPLISQLKEGGRLILPLGSTVYWQTLTMATKKRESWSWNSSAASLLCPWPGR